MANGIFAAPETGFTDVELLDPIENEERLRALQSAKEEALGAASLLISPGMTLDEAREQASVFAAAPLAMGAILRRAAGGQLSDAKLAKMVELGQITESEASALTSVRNAAKTKDRAFVNAVSTEATFDDIMNRMGPNSKERNALQSLREIAKDEFAEDFLRADTALELAEENVKSSLSQDNVPLRRTESGDAFRESLKRSQEANINFAEDFLDRELEPTTGGRKGFRFKKPPASQIAEDIDEIIERKQLEDEGIFKRGVRKAGEKTKGLTVGKALRGVGNVAGAGIALSVADSLLLDNFFKDLIFGEPEKVKKKPLTKIEQPQTVQKRLLPEDEAVLRAFEAQRRLREISDKKDAEFFR